MSLLQFRHALGSRMGQVLTPELCAAIEQEAFALQDHSIDPAQFAPETYDGLVFAVESLRAIIDELHPLHEAHWQETERARHGLPMKPNYDYMAAAERSGNLLQFTARLNGELVGNIRMYLYDDLHTGTRSAREDTLFLLPKVRHGFAASRFVDYAERCLKQAGCLEVTCDTKILHDEHGNLVRDVGVLLRRRGYRLTAHRYHKFL